MTSMYSNGYVKMLSKRCINNLIMFLYSAIIADQLIYGGGYHLYNWWLSDIYYNIKQLVRLKKGFKIITNVFFIYESCMDGMP